MKSRGTNEGKQNLFVVTRLQGEGSNNAHCASYEENRAEVEQNTQKNCGRILILIICCQCLIAFRTTALSGRWVGLASLQCAPWSIGDIR